VVVGLSVASVSVTSTIIPHARCGR